MKIFKLNIFGTRHNYSSKKDSKLNIVKLVSKNINISFYSKFLRILIVELHYNLW